MGTINILKKTAKNHLHLLQKITAIANEANSSAEMFRHALDLICDYIEWPFAHVYLTLTTEKGISILVTSRTWICAEDSPEQFTLFQEATADLKDTSSDSWLANIITTQEPAWSVDVRQEPPQNRHQIFEKLGIITRFAFPVMIEEQVVAVMEFFTTARSEPDDTLLNLAKTMGTQLGRAVERERHLQQIEQANSELRQREMLLAEAQSVASIAGWEIDVETDTITATSEMYTILGVQAETFTLTQENFLKMVPAAEREMVLQNMILGVQKKEPWDFFHRIMRPDDGSIRNLHVRNKPLFDEDGRLKRIIGVVQDITEQEKIRLQLANTLSLLADAQQIAQIGNWDYDILTGQVFLSDQLYRIYGLDPAEDELTSERIYSLMHPDDVASSRARTERALAEREAYRASFRINRADDGRMVYVEVRVEPIANEKGEVVKMRGTVQDITERKKAEAQIQRQLKQISMLSELGRAVVSILDLDLVLAQALKMLRPLLDVDGVFVLLKEEKYWRVAAASVLDTTLPSNARLPLTGSAAAHAIQSQEPYIGTEDAPLLDYLKAQHSPLTHIESVVVCPLFAQKEIIGALQAIHRQPNTFSDEEVNILQIAASWIAIAANNATLYDQIKRARRNYQRLTDKLVNAQENERRRIAQEIHDDVGQRLIALEMQIELLLAKMGDAKVEHPFLFTELDHIRDNLDELTGRMRNLAYVLRPPELETVGLQSALVDLVQEFQQNMRLPVHFASSDVIPDDLPDAIVITFYRFVQEALTNIVKHAQATQVHIDLWYDGRFIRLEVRDNGRGFDTAVSSQTESGGLGLLGMRERFTPLNGTLRVVSKADQGTTITAGIPWPGSQKDEPV